MKRFLILFALLFTASSANAIPLAGIVATAIGVSVSTVLLVTLAVTAVIGLSMMNKMKKDQEQSGGLKTERKKYGGVNPRSFIIGKYATAGAEVTPPMSQGNVDETPNAYLTYVVSLSDLPIGNLSASPLLIANKLTQIVVNGEYISIDASDSGGYGRALGGKYAGYGWIRFYDGRQTIADPNLVSLYSAYPDRPWTAAMVGTGCCYAILTFKYNAEIFQGEPEVKFELTGIPLYDPRKDTTVGGSGAHVWGDFDTYEISNNPIVMIYNLLRGIDLLDGKFYGGTSTADELPLSNWLAAMNICDESIALEAGGTEPRYRAGFEIVVGDDQPADIIDELLKTCSGEIFESGGVYKIRAGGPGLPVAFITDKDLIVSRDQDYSPIAAIGATYNQINHTYPAPEEEWNEHDGPLIESAEYLAEDDGIPRPYDIALPASPYGVQNQRLCLAWLNSSRRTRSHKHYLGHYGFKLEPLDVVSWTSARNGYESKEFDIEGVSENYLNCINGFSWLEVDPDDYDWVAGYELPDEFIAGNWNLPVTQVLTDWSVAATTIKDGALADRKPAVNVIWNENSADDATGIKIRYRIDGQPGTEIVSGLYPVKPGAATISDNIIANTNYQFGIIVVANRSTDWSAWLPVTTGNVLVGEVDISAAVWESFTDIAYLAGITSVSSLPVSGEPDQVVMLIPPGRLYRWDDVAGEWTQELYGGIEPGSVDIAAFAASIEPVGLIGSGDPLPTVKTVENINWQGDLYRWDGAAYVKTIETVDLVGTVSTAQIADAAITATKMGALAIESAAIAANAITETKIASNSVTTGKIAAGAVVADKIAAQSITASKLIIGDTSNMVPDWNQGDISGWTTLGSTTFLDPSIYFANTDAVGWRFSSNGVSIQARSPFIQVTPGESYYFGVWTFMGSGLTGPARIELYVNGQGFSTLGVILAETYTVGSWVYIEGQYLVPAGRTSIQMNLRNVQASNPSNLITYWTKPVMRRASGGELIVDGSITADKISANAVTADKISANAVTAGKIAAAAISATEIAASAITADKLFIGDTSNMVADWANGDISGWSLDGLVTFLDPTVTGWSDNDAYGWRYQSTGGAGQAKSHWVAVTPGEVYYISAWLYRQAGTGTGLIYINRKLTNGTEGVALLTTTSTTGAWVHLEGQYIIPSTVAFIQVWLGANQSSSPANPYCYWTKPVMRRASSGELIVDGAITANKISAGSVTTDKVAAGAIVANAIASNAVTADKILANAVTADKINVSSLDAVSATVGVLRTTTTGARLEIRNDKILVYDASNVLRVKIGNLA